MGKAVGLTDSHGLARIIHERFYCNRGLAAATSLSAGVLAAQSLTVLFQVRFGPSRLCLPVSQRDSTISRRTVMNNAVNGCLLDGCVIRPFVIK